MEFIKIHGQRVMKVIIRNTRIYVVRTTSLFRNPMAGLETAGNQELRASQCGCKPHLLVATCCKSGLIDWINVQCYILRKDRNGKNRSAHE